jgi:hypothetical protein
MLNQVQMLLPGHRLILGRYLVEAAAMFIAPTPALGKKFPPHAALGYLQPDPLFFRSRRMVYFGMRSNSQALA